MCNAEEPLDDSGIVEDDSNVSHLQEPGPSSSHVVSLNQPSASGVKASSRIRTVVDLHVDNSPSNYDTSLSLTSQPNTSTSKRTRKRRNREVSPTNLDSEQDDYSISVRVKLRCRRDLSSH